MARITIVRWRDIPAQVIVGKGRGAGKAALPERFEQAIDRAAMRAGLRGEDAYLAQWRREDAGEATGDPAEVAAALAAQMEAEYDDARLRGLVDGEGRSAGSDHDRPITDEDAT